MSTMQAEVSPLDYQTPQAKPRKKRGWFIPTLLTGGIVFGVASVLLPSMCRSSETANRAKCASNMHQIGLAILLYANEHGGAYPGSINLLISEEQLTPAVFICPSGNDEAADGKDTAEVIANVTTKPHHLSYVYIGHGTTTATAKANTVVLYEHDQDHAGEGINILFGDGHAEWETMPRARLLIPQLAAETRP